MMSSGRYRTSILTCFVTTLASVCGCMDSNPSEGTTSLLTNEQRGSKTVSTTDSPVVGAQVPVTLAGPLSDECAAWELPPEPTKGPIPPAAIGQNGMGEIWSLVPDFVPAWDGDKTAGYISKYDLLCNISDDPKPVWDDSLQHVVGHMVVGKGFVRSK